MFVVKCKTPIGDTDQYLTDGFNLGCLSEAIKYPSYEKAHHVVDANELRDVAKIRRFITAKQGN